MCGRGGHGGVDVADLLEHVGRDVAGHVVVDEQVAVAGGLDADDDGQLLVGDADALAGVLGDVAVGRDDHDDRLADVVDLVLGEGVAGAAVGQRRVRDEQGQRLADPAGEVLVDVDADDALDVDRVGRVDVDDAGVRVRAAHERGGEGVVPEVVEVAAAAGDEARVLLAPDRRAEHLRRHACSSAVAPPACSAARSALISAARRTLLTMFW